MEGIKIEYAPVLSPSTKEFANFREYIEKIENKYSKDYGMVKVLNNIIYNKTFLFDL